MRCPEAVTAARVLKPVHAAPVYGRPDDVVSRTTADRDECDVVADLTRSGDVGPAVPVVLIKDEILPVAEAHGRGADHIKLPVPVDVSKREVMAARIRV